MIFADTVHQVWLSPMWEMPDDFMRWSEEAEHVAQRSMLGYRLWTYADALGLIRSLGLQDLWLGYKTWVQRADVARAAIVYVCGGWYLDLDIQLHASLRPHTCNEFNTLTVTGADPLRPNLYEFAVFHAPPGNTALAKYLEMVQRPKTAARPVIHSTGPRLFNQAIRLANPLAPLKVLPIHSFHPQPWYDRHRKPDDSLRGTVGTHFFRSSWWADARNHNLLKG